MAITFAVSLFVSVDIEAMPRGGSVSKRHQKVLKYLNKQKRIRIFVQEAQCHGHQSSSIQLMDELRWLGYQGKFEVVYDDGAHHKLGLLVEGFNTNSRRQQTISSRLQDGTKVSATFIRRSHFDKGKPDKLELGLTGAYDVRGPRKAESCLAGTEGAHVKDLFWLQPQGWEVRSASCSTRGT